MRITVGGGAVQAHAVQHFIDPAAGLGGAGAGVQQVEVLGHQIADLPARIEAAVGVLKHHLDVAADGLQGGAARGGDVAALDPDAARLRRLQREDGAQQGGLAAAAFADQTDAFTGLDRQADLIDGAEGLGLAEQGERAAVFAHHSLDLKHGGGVGLRDAEARRGVGGVGQQALGIGMRHAGADARDGRLLDQFAVLHHRQPVGGFGHDGEVVGDEDQTHAVLAHQPLQQVQHLSLRRHVQRRRRLVRDQQFGRQGDGDGDGDALPLAARQFVRIAGQWEALGGQANPIQHGSSDGEGLLARGLLVQAHGLGNLIADGHDGVQGRHRLLKDDAHVAAADLLHHGVGGVRDDLTVQADLARHGRARRRQAQHGQRRH
ncbi:hypothetical protein ACMZ4W_01459 [Brevundimonas naejangsanensis]